MVPEPHPPRVAAILAQFTREHPEAKNVRVTAVTRRKVFLRFDSPRLGPAGLAVKEIEHDRR